MSNEKWVSGPRVSRSIWAIMPRMERLSSGVSANVGFSTNLRNSGIMFLMSMLMRRMKSGDMAMTSALKYCCEFTCRIFFGVKMNIESFFSRNSCRLNDTEVSPSVPTPIMKASMRHGNRKTCIWESLLAVMHSRIRP